MKTITKFETAEEFVRALRDVRSSDDESVSISPSINVNLSLNTNKVTLSGEGSDNFLLGDNVDVERVIREALKLIRRTPINLKWEDRP